MRQYVKKVLFAIFAVLIVSSMATVCMGYPMYALGVKEGDWVEYDVLEAENYKFFAEIYSGDKLRFEVVDIEVQERMYPNGTVVFEVEAPVCDVFLNGEHIGNNVTLGEMIFYPKGEEQIVHKDTEIALDFERYTYARENRTEYHLKICDTNVSGVLDPRYITYWYLVVLLAAVAFLAFAVLLKCRQSKKKGGQKDGKYIFVQ